MSLRNKAVHGAKWTTLQQTFGQLIDFVVFILLARLLGPEDFGLVAIAAVVVAFMGPLVSQGLGVAITQRSSLEPEHLDTAFWANLGLGFLLMMLLFASAGLWAAVFSQPQLEAILAWLSISFLFTSLMTVQEAVLRRELDFRTLAIRSLSARTIGGVVGVVLALNDYGVWSLVVRQLVATSVNVLLLWGISDWRPHRRFSGKHFRDLYPFGLKVMGNQFLIFVNRRSDNLLIGFFLGPTALGYYNIAYRFMSLVFNVVSKTVTQVGMPTFARLQGEPDRLKTAFYDITQLIALIAVPAFLGIMALVPEIVVSLLGEKWMPSIPVLRVLVLIGIVQSLLSPMISVLVGVGRPGLRLKLQVIDAVANLIGFMIAVHWGIVAVALSYVIVSSLLVPLWYRAVKSVVPIRGYDYLRLLVGPFVAATLMVLGILTTSWVLEDSVNGVTRLGLAILSGVFVYPAVVYWIYPDAARKIIDIVRILIKRKGKIVS